LKIFVMKKKSSCEKKRDLSTEGRDMSLEKAHKKPGSTAGTGILVRLREKGGGGIISPSKRKKSKGGEKEHVFSERKVTKVRRGNEGRKRLSH